jgi:lysophospholipase L1-like esterase
MTALGLLLVGCWATGAPPGSPANDVPTPTEPASGGIVRYVALGDSYTIGTGLPRRADNWPKQLERALRPGFGLDLVDNLAVNGNTTYEVIDEQLPVLEQLDPDLVSLQVGVNDVIGDVTPEEYEANLELILDGREDAEGQDAVIGVLGLVRPSRVILVSTPDYTLTPRGPAYRRPEDAGTIDRFNEILRAVAAARGITVVDISPISDLVPDDRTLITDDGLHPSAKQYAGWVELIAPIVRAQLAAPA